MFLSSFLDRFILGLYNFFIGFLNGVVVIYRLLWCFRGFDQFFKWSE